MGSVNIGAFREEAFTPDDAELLEQIAKPVAVAVENALNFQRAEPRTCARANAPRNQQRDYDHTRSRRTHSRNLPLFEMTSNMILPASHYTTKKQIN